MRYVGKLNKHGQTILVAAETAHLPHVRVSWYAGGMWASGHAPVMPGETPEQAGKRAFGDKVPNCYAHTIEMAIEELV